MFHKSPELCLLREVDDRVRWVSTGCGTGRSYMLWQEHEGRFLNIGDDVIRAEHWVTVDRPDADGLWVVHTGNGWRLATDDEDLAARSACGLPLPFWAIEDQSIPAEAMLCVD